jgi:hypothetical protein
MSEIVQKYLTSHCIGNEQVEKFKLKVYPGRISIPVTDADGEVLFYKHRHFFGTVKYTYDSGAKVSLFNIGTIHDAQSVFIVEGEMDAMACDSYGVAAVSSTGGSMSWQRGWCDLFKGKKVVVAYDRDDAGAQGAYRVWSSLNDAGVDVTIGIVPEGYGKDMSDFLSMKKDGPIGMKLVYLKIPRKVPQGGGSKREVKTSLKNCLEYIKLNENTHTRYLVNIFKKNLIEEIRHLDVTSRKKQVVDFAGGDIKKIPITDFLDFPRGVAHCLFHQDRNPSMVYNGPDSNFPNTVKCFACGKFGSVIDVVMVINELNFKQAVDFLKKKL